MYATVRLHLDPIARDRWWLTWNISIHYLPHKYHCLLHSTQLFCNYLFVTRKREFHVVFISQGWRKQRPLLLASICHYVLANTCRLVRRFQCSKWQPFKVSSPITSSFVRCMLYFVLKKIFSICFDYLIFESIRNQGTYLPRLFT